jgi:putative NADH-flavin reductase
MKVILFGTTGFVGGAIARELIARGHEVVGVARAVSTAAPDGVTVVEGSIHDRDFVRGVADGADAIAVAIPARAIDGKALQDAVPMLLDVAADRGLRLGIVGGAGGLKVAPGGPRLVDTPEFPELYKSESLAAIGSFETLLASNSNVDWFYLSPAAGFGSHSPGEATGSYRVGDNELVVGADGKSYISGADFAKAFIDEFETPAHHQQRFTVGY